MEEEKKESTFNSEENNSVEKPSEDHHKSKMKSHHNHSKSKHHKSHSHHKKSSETITIKKPDIVNSMQKNPWIIATIVLALLALYLFYSGSGQVSVGNNPQDKVIASSEATQIVLDFAASQGLTAEHINTSEENGLYKVELNIQGQQVPVYLTKDGENLVPSLVPLSEIPDQGSNTGATPTPTNIPQSERPNVELFVMSHCPYGTQIEKGMLPVVKELKDKIDFEVKFVYYAMHPTAGEVEEQLNQYCIQEEQNDKYLQYLSCFLEDADGETCLDEVGVDRTMLESCTTRVDAEYDVIANLEDTSSWVSGRFPQFNIHKDENDLYGVQGSPTLVINGVQATSNRDAQSLLNTVCSSFTDKPEECNTDMTSFGSPGPGFGFDTQGGSAATAGCAF